MATMPNGKQHKIVVTIAKAKWLSGLTGGGKILSLNFHGNII